MGLRHDHCVDQVLVHRRPTPRSRALLRAGPCAVPLPPGLSCLQKGKRTPHSPYGESLAVQEKRGRPRRRRRLGRRRRPRRRHAGHRAGGCAPPPPRQRPPVATEALRDRIVEKVKENRVTLIVGDTGCGNDPPALPPFDTRSFRPRSLARIG
jgi:hypothetical protein